MARQQIAMDLYEVANLEAELAKEREKVAKWERVFGHLGTADECGNEWIALQEQLATAQATIAEMREALDCLFANEDEKPQYVINALAILRAASAVYRARVSDD